MDLAPEPPKCHWHQWLALFAASSAVCSASLEETWFSFEEQETEFKSPGWEQIGVTSIGAIIGAVVADMCGRKKALKLASIFVIPRVIALLPTSDSWKWINIYFSSVGSGMTSTVVPLYISEIASTYNRGKFLVMPQMVTSSGLIVTLLFGIVCDIASNIFDQRIVFGVLIAAFMVFHIVTLFVLPDTPYYLNWKKGSDETIKSLTFFKGIEFVTNPDPANLLLNSHVRDTSSRGWFSSIRKIFESESPINIMTILFLVTFRAATVNNKFAIFVPYSGAEILKDPEALGKTLGKIVVFRFSIRLISSIFIMFSTRLLRRKSSLLVTIFVGLIFQMINATSVGSNEVRFYLNIHVLEICNCIFEAVVLIHAGEFFPINIRAIAMAVIVSWDAMMCYLALYTDLIIMVIDLLGDKAINHNNVSTYVTLHSILSCSLFLAGFIWVLAFYPSTHKVPSWQLVIKTTGDDDNLKLLDPSEVPESSSTVL